MKTHPKGFSLIELLIVVAIILIIAAIAIPRLLQSRIAANQSSAVGSLEVLGFSLLTKASWTRGVLQIPSITLHPSTQIKKEVCRMRGISGKVYFGKFMRGNRTWLN